MCQKMKKAERKAVAAKAVEKAIAYRESGIREFRNDKENGKMMVEMYRADCRDLKKVYSLFVAGKYVEAMRIADHLDTNVREAIDETVWNLIHTER